MGLSKLRKYTELTVRLHTAGEVWYPRLPCLFRYVACLSRNILTDWLIGRFIISANIFKPFSVFFHTFHILWQNDADSTSIIGRDYEYIKERFSRRAYIITGAVQEAAGSASSYWRIKYTALCSWIESILRGARPSFTANFIAWLL